MKSLIAYFLILMMGIDSPANLNNASNSNIIMKNNNLNISYENFCVPYKPTEYTYTFLDGTQKIFDSKQDNTMLMVNGSIYPNIILESKNNEFYIKLKDVKNELGLNISNLFKDNIIIINDDLYISLDVLCIDTNSKMDYYVEDMYDIYLLIPHDIITIDQRIDDPYISTYEAYDLLMENFSYVLTDCKTKFINTYIKYLDYDECLNRYLDFYPIFKKDISNIEYYKSISRYYVFKGFYHYIYVDKYTKDIYFGICDIARDIIKKADFDDMYTISYLYIFN